MAIACVISVKGSTVYFSEIKKHLCQVGNVSPMESMYVDLNINTDMEKRPCPCTCDISLTMACHNCICLEAPPSVIHPGQ